MEKVHVASSGQGHYFAGLQGMVGSLLKYTASPELLVVHIFCEAPEVGVENETLAVWKDYNAWRSQLIRQFPGFQMQFHTVTVQDVQKFIPPTFPPKKKRLSAPTNYVRFILHRSLSDVMFCTWIDSDIVVRGDFVLWAHRNIPFDEGLAAFPRNETKMKIEKGKGVMRYDKLEDSFARLRRWGLRVSHQDNPRFGAGLIILNLEFWRRHHKSISETLTQICDFNRNQTEPLHRTGSQAPLQYIFSGKLFHHLNAKEIVEHFISESDIPDVWKRANHRSVMFLHFTTQIKPWFKYAETNSSLGAYVHLWKEHSSL